MCGIRQHNLPPLDAVSLDTENWTDNQRKIRGAVTVTIGSRVRDSVNPDSDELFEAAGAPGAYYMRGLRVVSRLTVFAQSCRQNSRSMSTVTATETSASTLPPPGPGLGESVPRGPPVSF